MSKRKQMEQRIEQLQKQYENLVTEEQKKIGSYVISLYERNELSDHKLVSYIAKTLGDELVETSQSNSNITDDRHAAETTNTLGE